MNRLWTALLLLATVVVAGAVVYVVAHDDPVPDAGTTPGYSQGPVAPASGAAKTSASGSVGPTSPAAKQSSGTSGATPPVKKVVFLGDDWTKGVGTTAQSKRFADLFGKDLKVKTSAVGEPGAGYAKKGPGGKAYADLVDKVVGEKPDMIVVTGGRNDVSDDPGTLSTAAKNLFGTLKSKLHGVILVGVQPFWGDSKRPTDLSKVDTAVQQGVQAAGGTWLPLNDPIFGHSDYMKDAADPNDKGQQAIATALENALKTKFKFG